MHGVGLIGAIVIGVLAGLIAEKVMNRDHGFWMNLVVGLAGSLLGGFLAGMVGIHFWGWVGSLIVSTLGAILLLWLVGMLKK